MPIPGVAPLPIDGPGSAVGVDRPRFTAYAGDGSTWHLGDGTDDGTAWIVLMPGMTGLEHPPVTLYSASTPQLAGARYTGMHVEPRPVFIPIAVVASTYEEATELRRKLIYAFSPLNGDTRLEAAQPDGTTRTLTVRFTAEGMAGDESVDQAGLTWATYGLVGVSFDPFWMGEPVHAVWTNPAPRPFFPLAASLFRLSQSNILGDAIISNIGEVEAFPRWTLKGPATGLTISSGEQAITVNRTIPSFDLLIIDTDPTRRLVATGTGVNAWPDVPDGYKLWTLPPGNIFATFAVEGADEDTALYLDFTPRYLRW